MEPHALSVQASFLHPSQDEVLGRIRTPLRRFDGGRFSVRRRARRCQVGKLQGNNFNKSLIFGLSLLPFTRWNTPKSTRLKRRLSARPAS